MKEYTITETTEGYQRYLRADNFVESMELVGLLNLSYLANRTRKIIQNSKILQKSNFHGTYTHHPQILKIASWLRVTASS